jgi:hypothetical protein
MFPVRYYLIKLRKLQLPVNSTKSLNVLKDLMLHYSTGFVYSFGFKHSDYNAIITKIHELLSIFLLNLRYFY